MRIILVILAMMFLVGGAFAQEQDFFELVKTGTPAQVQAAIDGGAKVNEKDWLDNTPLMNAANNNSNPEVIKRLLDAGANWEDQDTNNRTPLMLAARYNKNPEVTLTLLQAKADTPLKTKKGWTAFDDALWNKWLRGTATYAKLAKACGQDFFLLAQTGTATQILDAIKAGANVGEKDGKGMTPLMHAVALNPDPNVTKVLLEAGAKVDDRDYYGKTPRKYSVNPIPSKTYCVHNITFLPIRQ